MEKYLDMIADFITNFGGWFFKWFGDRDDVKAIQEKTVGLCGFLPTAASVAAMVSAPNPVVTGVIGIATAICQAVSSSQVNLVGAVKTVNGVPIEGDFIKGK